MDKERVLPRILAYHLLEEMTNGFSEDRELGRGTYGKVYLARAHGISSPNIQGLHKDGETIAVKLLHPMLGLDDDQFEKEYHNLERLQHKNIVQLVGYCNETRREFVSFKGKRVLSEVTHRALCFEYMQNGSLDNCLSDESCGHDWHTRYAIIKGICKGVQYLHEELKHPIFHLDLKPANILLDENWVAKIADFGLSRLMGVERTLITTSPIGTIGYLPPEYINGQVISNKLDIFSVGVIIIKIMAGPMGFSRSAEISSQKFIDVVHRNWRNRLQEASMDALELYCEQIKRCITIALTCVEEDRHKRPTIGDLVNELNETETIFFDVNEIETISQFPDASRNTPGSSMDQFSGRRSSNKPGTGENYTMSFDLLLIDNITNNFSEDQKVGSGGYGDIYKAVHKGQHIAVKKLHSLQVLDDEKIHNEFCKLTKIGHKNILGLYGYFYESEKRVICFEYMQRGSLDKHISDDSCRLDWPKCYKIIKGTCDGLNHLHTGQEEPIFHLDLKPSNILLDRSMTPKIADLGLSTLVSSTKAHKTEMLNGTQGYMPPEYRDNGSVSNKFDMFSLGVIILKIMSGHMGYFECTEMYPEEFADSVSENWRQRLQLIPEYSSHEIEIDILLVRRCVEIALRCVETDPEKRPNIEDIVHELSEVEA